jgi:hypothetical protein
MRDLEAIRASRPLTAELVKDGHAFTPHSPVWRGKCPFHDDSKAKAWVSPETQVMGCWVCGYKLNIFEYVMKRDGASFGKAVQTLAQGLTCERIPSTKHPHVKPARYIRPLPENFMHPSLYEDFIEGQTWGLANPTALQGIADRRGWSLDFVRWAVESGHITILKINGKRLIAFPVQEWGGGGIYGLHIRWPDDSRAKWSFEPSGLPALPFWIGTPKTSTRFVICEGQWDALTLAYAWGWNNSSDNKGITILGLRGANGVRPFLDHCDLPPNSTVYLVPDNDKAGSSWTAKDGLLAQLRDIGHTSHIWRVPAPFKDVNEACKADTSDALQLWSEICR